MTEHQLQKLICNLLSYAGIYFFETDVMDGLKFCGSEKQRLAFINHHKAMGYKPGQSDLVIILPKRIVFVEIKNGKVGRQSEAQKKFQKVVESNFFEFQLWRNVEDCQTFIRKLRKL